MRKLFDWLFTPLVSGGWAPGQALLFLFAFGTAAGPIVYAIWTTP